MQKLFEKNIKFFYENSPAHYEIIKNLKSRNYYLKNDNLYDLNGNKIYPHSITKDSLQFSYYPTHNPLWEKKYFYITPRTWEENEFPITGKIINKMIKQARSLPSYTKEGFYFDNNFLPTTAIFGLLAGKHLNDLVDNFEFQSLFVYEPNPEFFAISLYYVDYEKIYKKLGERFFLWVNGTLDYFAIEKFYYERKITSSFLTLTLKTYNHPLIEDAINKFEEVRVAKFRGWGTYEDEIKGVKNYFANINKYETLMGSESLNVPFCVVANGKSLEKNIPFIKENKNSMIIISVGTALKPLMQHGIHSDFHIEQERIPLLVEALKDVLPKYEGYFVGANVVNPKVFQMAKKPYMYNREGFALSDYFLIGSSPLVGNAGFAFSANFTKEIYLCGMDLGFRLNENKHAKGSFYDTREDKVQSGIKIKGNFSDDIYTDSLFLSSKKTIELLIKTRKLNVYNLSDGAYIKGTTPLTFKKLPPIQKVFEIFKVTQHFKRTNLKPPKIELNEVILPVKKTLSKQVKNKKELTGLIDFLDNAINSYTDKHLNTGFLIRGSLTHILNNLYILAHKIDIKDFDKLLKPINKYITQYDKDFEALKREIKERR